MDACVCVLVLIETRKYEHFSHVSAQEYFVQLLTLHTIDWLRLPLLQGLATSAVAGAEGLVRASRAAVTQCLDSHGPVKRQEILMTFLQDLSTVLSDNLQDDRYAIPVIEFLAFLIDIYDLGDIPDGAVPRFATTPSTFQIQSCPMSANLYL